MLGEGGRSNKVDQKINTRTDGHLKNRVSSDKESASVIDGWS